MSGWKGGGRVNKNKDLFGRKGSHLLLGGCTLERENI